jgi:transcriptional regulator with XRE-family HTH domain
LFAERLRELRKAARLTQVQFSAEFNISNGTVAMWETGKREPDFSTVISIADFFGVTVDYLIGHDEEPASQKGGLSKEDESLILAYHSASQEDRQIIDNIVKRYIPSQEIRQIV